jgi:hypothetical protein
MGEITTISKSSVKQSTLRTVIPSSVIKQWHLDAGDKLEWEWKAVDGDLLLVVKKTKGKK